MQNENGALRSRVSILRLRHFRRARLQLRARARQVGLSLLAFGEEKSLPVSERKERNWKRGQDADFVLTLTREKKKEFVVFFEIIANTVAL